MATGNYIYRETDLSIPGINGLDLVIERQFDTSSSYLQTPSSSSNTSYDNTKVLKTGYEAFVSEAGSDDPFEASLLKWDAYTFMAGSDTFNRLKAMEREFTPKELDLAMAQLVMMTEETKGWVYGVRDNLNRITYAMVLRPTIDSVGSRLNKAFNNFGLPYNYMVQEYGLGFGWRLGFSAIERYFEGVDDPVCQRLITSEGYRYKVDFSGNSLPSNLEGYTLEDLRLEQTGNGYPGATYTLFYKDGKCEYFDSKGRNIAIVDRHGNKITLEYTVSQNSVTQIKIVDTVGNVILYTQAALNPDTKYYIPGEKINITNQYDCLWTLSLNGKTIRTYYSFTNPNATEPKRGRLLKAVDNELSERTKYTTILTTRKFNCILPSPDINDAQYAHAFLSGIQYPTGEYIGMQRKTNGNDRLNFLGYTVYSRISRYQSSYEDESGAEGLLFSRGDISYTFGDHTGYYGYLGSDSNYTSGAEYYRTRQVAPTETAPDLPYERYGLKSRDEFYTYDSKGFLVEKRLIFPRCTKMMRSIHMKILAHTATILLAHRKN